ncbi:hypothetical protein Tco_1143264 [Tanacetum coccineum]
MANTSLEEESFNPFEIGQDLFSYESPACLQFEQDTRNYDTIDPQNEIAGQTNPLLDKGGLTKRWHVCKLVQVFYDDGSGEDYGMWPTCNPDSSFCYGYKEVFRKSEQGMLRQWHSELGEKANVSESLKLQPFRPRPCDYSFNEWLKVKIGHTNIYDSDREIVFNEWILDIFDVEYEYAKVPTVRRQLLRPTRPGKMSFVHDRDFMDFSTGLLHFICSEAMLKGVSCSNSTLPVYFTSLRYNRDIVQSKWGMGVELSLDLFLPLIF